MEDKICGSLWRGCPVKDFIYNLPEYKPNRGMIWTSILLTEQPLWKVHKFYEPLISLLDPKSVIIFIEVTSNSHSAPLYKKLGNFHGIIYTQYTIRKVEPIKLKNTNWIEGGCEVGTQI